MKKVTLENGRTVFVNYEKIVLNGRTEEIIDVREENSEESVRFEFIRYEGNGSTVPDGRVAKFLTTQEQYRVLTGQDPSYFKGDKRPVERVSWYDAIKFCNLMSDIMGYPRVYTYEDNGDGTLSQVVSYIGDAGYEDSFKLPTADMWKWVAKGGVYSKGYKYAGSDVLEEVAWFDENSGDETHPVGELKPNELGVYDLSGNVWELSSEIAD